MPFLYEYCLRGEIENIKYMISNSYDYRAMILRNIVIWFQGLYGACLGGHKDIIEFLIEKISDCDITFSLHNWNTCLINACRGGHRDIVDMMIDRGANDYNSGLISSNYIDIARFMISRGANNWSESFNYFCRLGNLRMVELIIEKGGDKLVPFDWDTGMICAINGNYRDIANLLLPKCSNKIFIMSSGWIELILRIVYKVSIDKFDKYHASKIPYDILEIFRNTKSVRFDMNIKLFDRNLFGCVSDLTVHVRNKRKRNEL
jgi:ankyrin repeat protein